jgi:hypothetical protein
MFEGKSCSYGRSFTTWDPLGLICYNAEVCLTGTTTRFDLHSNNCVHASQHWHGEESIMRLQEWLDRLEEFDPDDWGQIGELRTRLSEEELSTELEAEITFRTVGGAVDRVSIRLLDDNEDAVVELDYDILQLDSVVLSEFIQEPAFPPEEAPG